MCELLQEANPSADITPDLFVLTTNEETKSVSIMAPDLLAPALLSRERIACKFSEHEDTTNSVDIYTEFSVHRRLHYGHPKAAIGLLETLGDFSGAVFCMELIVLLFYGVFGPIMRYQSHERHTYA
jgi:hypothetical protein